MRVISRVLRPLAIFIGSRPWLPRINKQLVAVDRFLHRWSRGRVGLVAMAGLPGLMLRVRGAKSGLVRSTPLLCVPHQDGWLVAGSNWGAPEPPAWAGNLAAAQGAGQCAEVTFRGRNHVVRPREVLGTEREELFAVMTRAWPNYATYAARTDRTLRVFLLSPA